MYTTVWPFCGGGAIAAPGSASTGGGTTWSMGGTIPARINHRLAHSKLPEVINPSKYVDKCGKVKLRLQTFELAEVGHDRTDMKIVDAR
jgi:hypothetical protein